MTIASIDEWGDNPARPPAGELPEPLLQRFLAQARNHGREIERLRVENAALNEEIMGYQVRDGYEKGHEHGQAAAVAEVLKLRVANEALRSVPKEIEIAARAIMSGAVWDGFNGPTGITKDEALHYAALVASWVLDR